MWGLGCNGKFYEAGSEVNEGGEGGGRGGVLRPALISSCSNSGRALGLSFSQALRL